MNINTSMVMITIIQLYDIATEVLESEETWLSLLLVYVVPDHHMHSLVFAFEDYAITGAVVLSLAYLPVIPSCTEPAFPAL